MSEYEIFKTIGGSVKSYAILRVGKIKTKGGISAALSHNLRERETPNADIERVHENTVLKGADSVQGGLNDWADRAPEKIRTNAVLALEYFVGGSPERINAMSRDEQDAYFSKALQWFETRHGAENVLSAIVHRDETTPHMQILVIPLDERNKLNARALVGGKENLRQLQTDFAEQVGLEFGLQRGIERSVARHHTIKEYYSRAQTPVEAEISLPEKHSRKMLTKGETDEEWRQRASIAVSERIAHITAHLTETNHSLNRRLATVESKIESQEKATRIAEQFALVCVNFDPDDEKENTPENVRKMATVYNRFCDRWTVLEKQLAGDVAPDVGLVIKRLSDGPYALSQADAERMNISDWSQYDRKTVADHVRHIEVMETRHSHDSSETEGLKL
ncbi:MobV family relaxase [Brucella sp. TWI559]